MTVSAKIHRGDALEVLRTMSDESVQCVVTSPPYWGLRDYGATGQLGLERTPAEYISKMVDVFREVRSVLRKDGTLWLNMGDCYANDTKWGGTTGGKHAAGLHGEPVGRGKRNTGLKAKDLVGMPWELALALRDDGWWLRRDIIWYKKNPMPESVTDRPTTAHEYIFLLTRNDSYFYDAEAIKEDCTGEAHSRGNGVNPKSKATGPNSRQLVDRDPVHLAAKRSKQNESFSGAVNELVASRNKRSVWEVATQPFPEAHFATFPEELITPCILAGTSEKGCCIACEAPWERVIDNEPDYSNVPKAWSEDMGSNRTLITGYARQEYTGKHAESAKQAAGRRVLANVKAARDNGGDHDNPFPPKRTLGWTPSCKCEGPQQTQACVVLDPFCGSGTTGVVALRYQRNFVGIELNPTYALMAERRILGDRPLFNRLETAEASA
jgi:DNA modification methylase